MKDIIELLRGRAAEGPLYKPGNPMNDVWLMREAADEIERLRELLNKSPGRDE